tara:strand:- start:10677 stop:10967 length:291 start_codon:yes stop_codon:yes gene_type:complete
MEKIKLKTGREISIKDVSLDERDEMLDSVEYTYDKKGNVSGVKMMHSTVTKWLRNGLNGQATDEFILGLTFEERTEIFLKMQEKLLVGEGNASNSK